MDKPRIVLAGHPFASIGCAESLRCSYRALRAVGTEPGLVDMYGAPGADPAERGEFEPALVREFGDINVFHLNADEVPYAMEMIGPQVLSGAYNILYPYWELERFPADWVPHLQHFDELWAPSAFIAMSLRNCTDIPVHHLPTACEVAVSSLLSRRHFGIPESAYVFLFFFDFRSYAARKNPQAGIAAFARLLEARPQADVCLVLKIHGADHDPAGLALLREQVRPFGERVLLIEETYSDNRIKNLVRACDCFLSLHRSEGFGRGLAEAMFLGKPVIATGYSGNLDFMDADSALLLDYTLVPVGTGEYPHAEGQSWAEPDLEQAVRYMTRLLDDPRAGRELGKRASRRVRTGIGYRPVGLAYRARLAQIGAMLAPA
jgi:glycosyltransferase involved in cell wall biosynthesis